MSRFARDRRVFFVEEPVFEDAKPHLRSVVCPKTGVHVQTPVLPNGMTHDQVIVAQRELLDEMVREQGLNTYVAWYYTPMALQLTSSLQPAITVYDCMDELAAFAGAPPEMRTREEQLFRQADLVFTGGATLFESKRQQHSSVHLFPSSVDTAHFATARHISAEPDDQRSVPQPRIGYAGVIDERMNLALLRDAATARPEWHFVLLGPVVKIDPASLPRANNIHYLGMKSYSDLPAYLSGWTIGMLPFALNDSTRFISPTKTPEYLAAGLQVISTPIRDVVTPYGNLGLVGIASDASEFVSIADSFLESPPSVEFRERVDNFLSKSSWEKTWSAMNQLIQNIYRRRYASASGQARVTTASEIAVEGAAHV